MIWLTSDLHLGHDREFIWKARGFNDINEMNETIVERWNQRVQPADVVFILGDVMLGDNTKGLEYASKLNGKLYVIRGNHDTDTRVALYRESIHILEVYDAYYLRYNGYHFYLTHYPCLTGNLEKESLKQMTLNLSGHTHSKDKFFYDLPYVYNVAMDAHDCMPVSIDEIIEDMKNKVKECQELL